MKAYRIIHTAANITAFGALAVSLVFLLVSWSGLPDTVGVHFNFEGEFDVFADKRFAFYPFAAGFGLLGIFSLLSLGLKKVKKLGLGLNEKNETIFRHVAVLFLDAIKLIWSAFFTVWNFCVIYQVGMKDYFPLSTLRTIMILIFIPLFLAGIAAATSSSLSKRYDKNSHIFLRQALVSHIIINIIAFGSLAVFLIFMLLSYNRLPDQIGVHFGHDGGFDVKAGKIFGFYPFVAGFGLMIIFSLISLAVNKVKKIGIKVTEAGDRLIRCIVTQSLDAFKLLWASFFSVWSYHVIHQTPANDLFLSFISISFFLILLLGPLTVIFTAKRYREKK